MMNHSPISGKSVKVSLLSLSIALVTHPLQAQVVPLTQLPDTRRDVPRLDSPLQRTEPQPPSTQPQPEPPAPAPLPPPEQLLPAPSSPSPPEETPPGNIPETITVK